jgi:hypothetical protein
MFSNLLQNFKVIQITSKSLNGANTNWKQIGLVSLTLPFLHFLVFAVIKPETAYEIQNARLLGATLQQGLVFLFSAILGLQSIRWQLEEGYANSIFLDISPKQWLMGNYLNLATYSLLLSILVILTILGEHQFTQKTIGSPETIGHTFLFGLNIWLGSLTLITTGLFWSIFFPKSTGFVFICITLSLWLGLIKEPLSYILPPINLLDAKGILIEELSNAKQTVNLSWWAILVIMTLTYNQVILQTITTKKIFKLLKR